MTWNTCVTDNHGYAPFVVVTAQFFPQSWLISGFLTRIKRRVILGDYGLVHLKF